MTHFKSFIAYGVDFCLALVALLEASLILFEDFSGHPFDLVVLSLAFGMTVFSLFRSLRTKLVGQRRAY
jgi:tetrahydromethanopterin S-methyltransferase subunit E